MSTTAAKLWNPYLDEVDALPSYVLEEADPYNFAHMTAESMKIRYESRDRLIAKYAYAIPSEHALRTIAAHSPGGVLEVFAGIGYWARCLRERFPDLDVIATDRDPGSWSEDDAGVRAALWIDVLKLDAEAAVKLHGQAKPLPPPGLRRCYCRARIQHGFKCICGPEQWEQPAPRSLLICWPPYKPRTTHGRSHDARALKLYRGPTVIYVGEGDYGCTGSKWFHRILDEEWEQIDESSIPQWHGIHDRLYVYGRKP